MAQTERTGHRRVVPIRLPLEQKMSPEDDSHRNSNAFGELAAAWLLVCVFLAIAALV